MSGNPTFIELLARVRRVSLEAYAHQDVPFAKIVEALHPQRRLNVAPLFQVKLVYHNVPLTELDLPGLEITPVEIEGNRTELDLVLHLFEDADGLRAAFEYRTELFAEPTIVRFSSRLRFILEQVTGQSGTTLEQLRGYLMDHDDKQTEAAQLQRQQDNLRQLRGIKRKPIRLTAGPGGQP
jgi:non-ribosomal peptide synthetase component F